MQNAKHNQHFQQNCMFQPEGEKVGYNILLHSRRTQFQHVYRNVFHQLEVNLHDFKTNHQTK